MTVSKIFMGIFNTLYCILHKNTTYSSYVHTIFQCILGVKNVHTYCEYFAVFVLLFIILNRGYYCLRQCQVSYILQYLLHCCNTPVGALHIHCDTSVSTCVNLSLHTYSTIRGTLVEFREFFFPPRYVNPLYLLQCNV